MPTMPVSTTAWIVSLGFGLLMGAAVGVRRDDRRTIGVTIQVIVAIGGLIWLTGPENGSEVAVAAVAMSLGGLAALLGLWIVARLRPV